VFESIQGQVVRRDPAQCVIQAGGLGYLLHVSLTTYDALPAPGEHTQLLLHPVIREDEWRLFGFARAEEREVFRALLRVNGVGPQMALGLLSGFRPEELARAVGEADIGALTTVKGIGKKTAERIVVELRDRWKDAPGVGRGSVVEGAPAVGAAADAVRALMALGLEESEAAKRVAAIAKAEPDLAVSDLVRKALRR
jgi:Holliday junction DNA helicase RuvA